MEHYQMYINGEWTGADLSTIDVKNPATNEVVATVPNGGAEEAKKAIDAANDAFYSWSTYSAYERSDFIRKWHDLINKHCVDLAKTMTMEQGKPLNEAIGE